MFHDKETNRNYVFQTNNFRLAVSTIAAIYKRRWQIELFFKWIKQNQQIKTFLGTSENAFGGVAPHACNHFLWYKGVIAIADNLFSIRRKHDVPDEARIRIDR